MIKANAKIINHVKIPRITQFLHLFNKFHGKLLSKSKTKSKKYKLENTYLGGKWDKVESRISGALSVPVGMVFERSTLFLLRDLSSSESRSKFFKRQTY